MSLMAKNRHMMEDRDASFLRQRSGWVYKRHECYGYGILIVISAGPKCASGYNVNLSQYKNELEVSCNI